MAETMYAAPGVGLAATQVDVHKRVIVIDASESRNELLVLINPEIVSREGAQYCEEGCLPVPGIYEQVEGAKRVTLAALYMTGRPLNRLQDKRLGIRTQRQLE